MGNVFQSWLSQETLSRIERLHSRHAGIGKTRSMQKPAWPCQADGTQMVGRPAAGLETAVCASARLSPVSDEGEIFG